MTGWEIWDHFQVRSAGFPARWLDGLNQPRELDFETRVEGERRHLKEVYQSLRIQEAVVWQNPDLAANFLFPWLDRAELASDRSDARRVERKLLAYLQRYCAKNEAIGTFGPIGWGRLRDDLSQPCDEEAPWLVVRTVYWEPWLFGQLCQHWPCQLTLSPRLRLQGGLLLGEPRTRRRDGGVQLTAAQQRILSAPASASTSTSEEEHETIAACLQRGWLSRTPAVPSSPRPEAWARSLNPESEQLDRLREHKERLERSRENPRELLARSLELRETLRQWGLSDSRFPGKTYSGRLPYYEDAQRRSLDLPSRYLDRVVEPLSLVLESARWFISRAESRFQERLRELCARLIGLAGEGSSATALWDHGNALFKDPETLGLPELSRRLSRTWRELLESCRDHSSGALASEVSRAFASPPVKAPRGRFHSVDLFFTPGSGAVLGEIHPGLYPFHDISTNFQHPQPEELSRWYGERAGAPEIWPAWQMSFSRLTQDGWADSDGYHLLVNARWGSWREPERQLRLGDFSLFSQAPDFVVRHSCGLEVTPLVFLQNELLAHLNSAFKPFDFDSQERPRIVIDGLTVARRRWLLRPAQLRLSKDREARYRQLNSWADERGLPDELFVSIPQEVKPVLWQRRSALSCDLFSSMACSVETVKLEEMWPERSQAWVANPDGVGTGEFRFVAFDQRADHEK